MSGRGPGCRATKRMSRDALRTKHAIDWKRSLAAAALGAGALASTAASAGGISLYEVGTADVGLASAGYAARAQDASTVFTNPAGMTRLAGDQLTLGAQLLHGDLGFSIGQGTTPGARRQCRRQSDRLVARRRLVLFAQRVAGLQGRPGDDRQLRIGREVRFGLGRAISCAGRNAARRLDPSVGGVARQRAALGGREPQRDGRQAREQGGRQQRHRARRQPFAGRQRVGLRRKRRSALRSGSRHARRRHLHLAGQPRFPRADAVGRPRARHPDAARVARAAGRGRRSRRHGPAGRERELLPRDRSALGRPGQRRLAAMVEVRPGGRRGRLEQSRRADHQPRLQGHLARRRRRAIPVVRCVAAQWRHRLRLGIPGQRRAWRWRCRRTPPGASGSAARRKCRRRSTGDGACEYLYGGSLHSNIVGSAPVALGGRGDVVGSFNDVGFLFLAANFNWKF